jgi:hypothetical protein
MAIGVCFNQHSNRDPIDFVEEEKGEVGRNFGATENRIVAPQDDTYNMSLPLPPSLLLSSLLSIPALFPPPFLLSSSIQTTAAAKRKIICAQMHLCRLAAKTPLRISWISFARSSPGGISSAIFCG